VAHPGCIVCGAGGVAGDGATRAVGSDPSGGVETTATGGGVGGGGVGGGGVGVGGEGVGTVVTGSVVTGVVTGTVLTGGTVVTGVVRGVVGVLCGACSAWPGEDCAAGSETTGVRGPAVTCARGALLPERVVRVGELPIAGAWTTVRPGTGPSATPNGAAGEASSRGITAPPATATPSRSAATIFSLRLMLFPLPADDFPKYLSAGGDVALTAGGTR
jgi:hypothetical protein